VHKFVTFSFSIVVSHSWHSYSEQVSRCSNINLFLDLTSDFKLNNGCIYTC